MARNRYRYFQFILYPDNFRHVDLLHWLSTSSPYQGCYILHQPEEEGKKPHYHVEIYYPTERTEKGVQKSFGTCEYYTDDEGVKKPVPDDMICDDSETDFIVTHVEATRDIHSEMMYLLHKNYASIVAKKREYNIEDIKPFHGDYSFIERTFELDKECGTLSAMEEIMIISDGLSFRELMQACLANRRYDLIKYIEAHAFLIKQILGGR